MADHVNWTFLVPHAGNPAMLMACLTSIKTVYPHAKVIVGVRGADPLQPRAVELAYLCGCKTVTIPGNGDDTDVVMGRLAEACTTEYAVYMEADCLLLEDIDDLCDHVEAGGFVGVHEVIPWPEGRPGSGIGPNQAYFRHFPGFHTASFWLGPVGRLVRQYGSSFAASGRGLGEPYYGLSQKVRDLGLEILELEANFIDPELGFATAYSSSVVHMWFGAWRLRDNVESASGVPLPYLQVCEANLLSAFWLGTLKGVVDARLSDEIRREGD